MVDLSKLRSWDASRAVQRRGGEAAMVSTLQWEAKKFTTWRQDNQGNFKAAPFPRASDKRALLQEDLWERAVGGGGGVRAQVGGRARELP